jgi:hypothetical protein
MTIISTVRTVSRSIAGAANALLSLPATGAITLLLTASPIGAIPCAGFVDVDDASGFCPNVEWVKNRSIALGCTSTPSYCPGEPMSRQEMAAAMKQLGSVLTPMDLPIAFYGGVYGSRLAPPVIACYAATTAGAFPQRAHFQGAAYAWGPWDSITFAGELVYSKNAADWVPISGSAAFQSLRLNRFPSPPADFKTIVIRGALDLEVGSSYLFAIRMWDAGNSPYPLVELLDCTLDVQIANRNATALMRSMGTGAEQPDAQIAMATRTGRVVYLSAKNRRRNQCALDTCLEPR